MPASERTWRSDQLMPASELDAPDQLDGAQDLGQVGSEGDEFSQGEVALDGQDAAVPDDGDGAEVGDQVEQGNVEGLLAGGFGGQAEPGFVLFQEAVDFPVFLGEGFDDLCAAEILFQAGGQDGELVLDFDGEGAEDFSEGVGPVEQEGEHQHDQEGQVGIHREQDDGGGDEQKRALDQAQNSPPGKEADAFDILDRAGEDLPGLGLIVEGEGQGVEFVLDFVAEVKGDLLGDFFRPFPLVVGEEAFEEGEA